MQNLKILSPDIYLSDNYVVLDFETTNLDKGSAFNPDNRLLMYSAKLSNSPVRECWGNEYTLSGIIEVCERADFVVAHNSKFELKWLQRAGADLSKILVFDTMIAEYVLYGNQKVKLGLGEIAKRYGYPGKEPYVDLCMKGGVCPSELPPSMLESRCNYDVCVTEAVFLKQRQHLLNNDQLRTLLNRCLLTPVLADIERHGMHLDPDVVLSEWHRTREELTKVNAELSDMAPDINFNSAKQKGEFIYDVLGFKELTRRGQPIRTDKDARKTDTATLVALKATTKRQRRFVEIIRERNKLESALSKNLNQMRDCVEAGDLLQFEFNQCLTQTHRLSSSGSKYGMQGQNLPRTMKRYFSPRNPDWVMCEADGSQLEFRGAAAMSRDSTAIQDIRDSVDVHSFTAKTLTEAGQETDRQTAKIHTFKPLYGGESGTPAEQAYYAAFKERYPGIADMQQDWKFKVAQSRELRTPCGLILRWPKYRAGMKYNPIDRQICNYPVQGFATADVIPVAIVYIWHEFKRRGLQSLIVNTIHDSIIMEVHPDEQQQVRDICVDCFTHKVYHYMKEVHNFEFHAPLGIGIKFGTHWSLGEEETLNVEPRYEQYGQSGDCPSTGQDV